MGFFARLGAVYCRTMFLSFRQTYGECKKPWQALAFFLEGYAFERQGRNPGYAHAAADAVRENSDLLGGNIDENVEREIWDSYRAKLRNRRLNAKLCPLNPAKSDCAGSVFARLREHGETNLMTFTTALLKKDVREAHNFIWSIRGSGTKIASYFLRDVKELYPIAEIAPNLRFLLQPVDIWVWRTVNILQGHEEFPSLWDAKESARKDAAQFIVNSSHDPERVNMGMWYFAAEVCGSEYRHGLYLGKPESAEEAWHNYVQWKVEEAKHLRTVRPFHLHRHLRCI